jgi:hypothetical protein
VFAGASDGTGRRSRFNNHCKLKCTTAAKQRPFSILQKSKAPSLALQRLAIWTPRTWTTARDSYLNSSDRRLGSWHQSWLLLVDILAPPLMRAMCCVTGSRCSLLGILTARLCKELPDGSWRMQHELRMRGSEDHIRVLQRQEQLFASGRR